MHSALSRRRVSLDLVKAWDRDQPQQKRRGILAHHLALDDHMWIQNASLDDVLDHLDAWIVYNSDVMEIAKMSYPSRSPDAQALLGFHPARFNFPSSTFIVLQDSFLHTTSNVGGAIEVSGSDVDRSVAGQLPLRLTARLHKLHKALLEPSHGLRNHFRRISSPRSSHSATDFSYERNAHAQVISKILLIFHHIPSKDRAGITSIWLKRLFDILRPLSGEILDLSTLRTFFDRDDSTPILLKWLEQSSSQVWSSHSIGGRWHNAFIALTLSLAMGRAVLNGTINNMRWSGRLVTAEQRIFVNDLISIFEGSSPDCLVRVTRGLG